MKVEVLSLYKEYPFGYSVKNFFKSYHVSESIEVYYLHYDPDEYKSDHPWFGKTTNVNKLSKIDYKSKIIFWVTADAIIDKEFFDYYTQKIFNDFIELQNICKLHEDKVFILLTPQYNLQNWVSVKNLFVSNFMNSQLTKKYTRCTKKFFDRSFITFNRNPAPHRSALICYLLSKNMNKYGSINFNRNFFLKDSFNFFKYFRFSEKVQKELKTTLSQLSFDYLDHIQNDNILPFTKNFIDNYNQKLLPIYEHAALEIISGSLFLEPTPIFSEKEIQSVYGKVFPIFINTHKSVSIWKEIYGIDVFEDVVDHSYDSIEDPTERLLSAIDLNIHLLNGTTNLESLWLKNKERFEENCNKMDELLYGVDFQQQYDEEKIKNALDYFGIKYTDVTVGELSTTPVRNL